MAPTSVLIQHKVAVYCYWLLGPVLQNAFCQQNVSELGILEPCCLQNRFLGIAMQQDRCCSPQLKLKMLHRKTYHVKVRFTWDPEDFMFLCFSHSSIVNVSCPCFVACQRLHIWLCKLCSVCSIWKKGHIQVAFMWKGNMARCAGHDIAVKGVIKTRALCCTDDFSTLLKNHSFCDFLKKSYILFSIASIGTTGRNWCSHWHLS